MSMEENMFGGNEYWWAAVLMLLLFITLNLIVFLLRNKPRLSYAIAYTIALLLLIYKTGENIRWQIIGDHMNFPVEFSAVSYFLFGIFIVLRIRQADTFAVFAAILAGTMYHVAFWVLPDSFLPGGNVTYLLVMAIINHSLLYLGGMLMLVNARKFRLRDCYQSVIGIGLLIGYSWMIHLHTDYSALKGKPIIIQITDGTILYRLSPTITLTDGLLTAYYIALTLLVCALFAALYTVNHASARRRARLGLDEDALPRRSGSSK